MHLRSSSSLAHRRTPSPLPLPATKVADCPTAFLAPKAVTLASSDKRAQLEELVARLFEEMKISLKATVVAEPEGYVVDLSGPLGPFENRCARNTFADRLHRTTLAFGPVELRLDGSHPRFMQAICLTEGPSCY